MADNTDPVTPSDLVPDDNPKEGDVFTSTYRSEDGRFVVLTARRWMIPPPTIDMYEGEPARRVRFVYVAS